MLCAVPALAQPANQPTKPAVDDLIQQLASKIFKERQNATKLLVERKDAAAALKKALKSDDLEVCQRVAAILQQRARRQALQGVERLQTLVKAGAVDQVAELLARWPEGQEEAACWTEVCKLGTKLLELYCKHGEKTEPGFFPAKKAVAPKIVVASRIDESRIKPRNEVYFLRAGEIDYRGLLSGPVAACSGSFRTRDFCCGVIFAAGPVEIQSADLAFIVSDGDVKADGVTRSLVIAGGTVTRSGEWGDCQIISSKDVRVHSQNGVTISYPQSVFA